jgi:hypothetical protein
LLASLTNPGRSGNAKLSAPPTEEKVIVLVAGRRDAGSGICTTLPPPKDGNALPAFMPYGAAGADAADNVELGFSDKKPSPQGVVDFCCSCCCCCCGSLSGLIERNCSGA